MKKRHRNSKIEHMKKNGNDDKKWNVQKQTPLTHTFEHKKNEKKEKKSKVWKD